MEINLNCDLGEKSIHYDGINDNKLLSLINSANIACGYHAGNNKTIDLTIKTAIAKNVSFGAHPGYKDPRNFGRKKIYLTKKELIDLIWKQLELINTIALRNNSEITHVKPHGALNNLACEEFDVAFTIGKAIKDFNKDLIYVVLPLNQMEKAATKLNLKYACEIFADRNYDDKGQLISRNKNHSMINDPNISAKNVIEMLNNSSILCLSGKKIKCNIDTVCIHGDGKNSVSIAKHVKETLLKNKFKLINLNKMSKFN